MRAAVALRTAVLCGALLTPSMARAQEGPEAIARRGLLVEAERARRAGDHDAAIERALRAAAIRATPSVSYFLAREYEATDRPLAALEHAGACARGAEADPVLRNRAVLLSACNVLVARLEPRVGRLTVRLAAATPAGAVVRVRGAALSTAVLGVPYPVAPGDVDVAAGAPGFEPFARTVHVGAGESASVEVTLVETSPPPPLPPPPPPPVRDLEPVAVTPPPPPPSPPVLRRSVAPLVAGAVAGGAALAVTVGLFVASRDARDARDAGCPAGSPCDGSSLDRARDDDNRYRAFAYAGDAALGVGVAALVAGGIVWWLSRPTARAPVVTVTPTAAAGAFGVAVAASL